MFKKIVNKIIDGIVICFIIFICLLFFVLFGLDTAEACGGYENQTPIIEIKSGGIK